MEIENLGKRANKKLEERRRKEVDFNRTFA